MLQLRTSSRLETRRCGGGRIWRVRRWDAKRRARFPPDERQLGEASPRKEVHAPEGSPELGTQSGLRVLVGIGHLNDALQRRRFLGAARLIECQCISNFR